MEEKKIVVIGVGVVGSVLAAALVKHNKPVVLVEKSPVKVGLMQKEGYKIGDPNGIMGGSYVAHPQIVHTDIADLRQYDIETIFVCVKMSFMDSVLPELQKIYQPHMKLVSYQNGLDSERTLAEAFGTENVFRVVINYAGVLQALNETDISFFQKPNFLGCLDSQDERAGQQVAELLTEIGLDTAFTHEIGTHIWTKSLLNSALCSISALTGMTMGQAMACEDTFRLVKMSLEEGIAVGKAHGIPFEDGFLDFCISYLKKGGNHKASMLIDVENGTRCEIDYLNGKLVEYGHQYQIPTPCNDILTCLVKGLERRLRLESV